MDYGDDYLRYRHHSSTAEDQGGMVYAAYHGRYKRVRQLAQSGHSVEELYTDGSTPLMLAAETYFISSSACYPETIQTLLDLGADANIVNNHTGMNALSVLLKQRKANESDHRMWVECLKIFISFGAGPSTDPVDCLLDFTLRCSCKRDLELCNLVIQLSGPSIITKYAKFHKFMFYDFNLRKIGPVTPFIFCLLTKNYRWARELFNRLYLTTVDLNSLPQNSYLLQGLRKYRPKCYSLLQEYVVSHPFSLYQLSFVRVSTILGPAPNRHDRVRETGLPPLLRRRLLFQEK